MQALEILATRGYQEAITYAFVDPALQGKLFPGSATPVLSNPISSDMAVMRTSLWPGLIKAALDNQRRQQDRIRLFEHGARFEAGAEIDLLAGIAIGSRKPEQWGADATPVDFFDVKQDLDALFARTGATDEFGYIADSLPCLHPGRSARVTRAGKTMGWIGELHPQLVQEFDFTYAPILFEVEYLPALAAKMPRFEEISRFPRVRRDLAVVVDEKVSLRQLHERVTFAASSLLRDIRVFDVFRGPGIETGRKSVALGLIFQDNSRTLADEDADRLLAAIRTDLSATLGAGFENKSMALTKAEMAEALFNQLGLNKREARELVDLFFEEVRHALSNGEQVKLSGFGNFDLRDKNQRPGRNPKTGEEIPISARRVVTFRPGQKLKARVEAYAGTKE